MKLKKIEKIEIKKTERFVRKAPLFIAKHIFEFSLIALFLSLAIGVIVFYKYNILDQRIDLNNLPQTCLLEENSYQRILDVWEENEQMFNQADSRDYRNIFSTKD
ncbi:hypothetical protein KKC65_03225 [Patescibacteria group bacterium]|nr:hypothetical protein [Patescibacteria group bacterium]